MTNLLNVIHALINVKFLQRGFVEVEWKGTGTKSVHRVGDGGKVWLKGLLIQQVILLIM